MTVVIEQTGLCCGEGVHGSVALQTEAARRCLGSSGTDAAAVGLMINVGVYRDENIVEPAMATLVQQRLGLNADPIDAGAGGPGTFSFDIANGSCGFLNAVQVAAAYLTLNPGRRALILAGDDHPSKASHDEFPYTPAGAAALLASVPGEETGGFSPVHHACGPADYHGLDGFNDISRHAGDGRRRVSIERDGEYHDRLLAFAVTTVNEFLERHAVARNAVKLVASNPSPDFMANLAAGTGIPTGGMVDAHAVHGDTHTASVLTGFHEGIHRGLVHPGDLVLFVCAGSGLSVSCALYRHGVRS